MEDGSRGRRSWSSPALVPVGGKPHVVCSSTGSVDGYDPATGDLLWSFDEVAGNTSATPLPFADGKFLVGASPGREAGDRSEGAKKSNLAAAIEFLEGKPALKVLWRTEEVTPTFGSPIVYAGHAYWINRVGVVYCFDAETGALCYAERTKQSCWATPLGVGDRLYLVRQGRPDDRAAGRAKVRSAGREPALGSGAGQARPGQDRPRRNRRAPQGGGHVFRSRAVWHRRGRWFAARPHGRDAVLPAAVAPISHHTFTFRSRLMKSHLPFAAALALLALASPALAHFVWVAVEKDSAGQPAAHVWFSELAEPDSADLLDKITTIKVWSRIGRRQARGRQGRRSKRCRAAAAR